MKPGSVILLVVALSSFTNCGENKTTATEQPTINNTTIENKKVQTNPSTSSGNGITGTWKLRLEVFDDNGNRVPDEEEMKKGYGNNYMLQLNADGTCRIQQMFTGRYEKVNENGRDMLKVYRKRVEGEEDKDPLPDIYQLTSVKKDELVLQIVEAGEPSSFWFFQRIN